MPLGQVEALKVEPDHDKCRHDARTAVQCPLRQTAGRFLVFQSSQAAPPFKRLRCTPDMWRKLLTNKVGHDRSQQGEIQEFESVEIGFAMGERPATFTTC